MLKCQNAEIRRHLLRYRVLALCYTIECISDHSGIESDFFLFCITENAIEAHRQNVNVTRNAIFYFIYFLLGERSDFFFYLRKVQHLCCNGT